MPGQDLTMLAGVEAAEDRWTDQRRTFDGHAIGSRQARARSDGCDAIWCSDVQGCEVQPSRNQSLTQPANQPCSKTDSTTLLNVREQFSKFLNNS